MGAISGSVAGTIGTAVIMGAAATAASVAAKKAADERKKKANAMADAKAAEEDRLKNAPTPLTAEEKARAALGKKRKVQQISGGKTILASQYGGATDTATTTLLGQ